MFSLACEKTGRCVLRLGRPDPRRTASAVADAVVEALPAGGHGAVYRVADRLRTVLSRELVAAGDERLESGGLVAFAPLGLVGKPDAHRVSNPLVFDASNGVGGIAPFLLWTLRTLRTLCVRLVAVLIWLRFGSLAVALRPTFSAQRLVSVEVAKG